MKRDACFTIEQTYTDEFGEIDPETLAAAGQIWPQAEKLAISILHDEQAGRVLMSKACARVTRKRAGDPAAIKNLPAYLFQTWRRLLLREQKKEDGHQQREAEMAELQTPSPNSVPYNLYRKILFQEIYKHMDEQTRRVYRHIALGFTFPEIGKKLGRNPDVLRATFHKQIKKLMKQFALED